MKSKYFIFSLLIISSCTTAKMEKYPLSFGYLIKEVCNSDGDVITKYEYWYDGKMLKVIESGLFSGKSELTFGKEMDAQGYYLITENSFSEKYNENGALVKFGKKGKIIEIIPLRHGESWGVYKYTYSNDGRISEAQYFPKVALDEPKIELSSTICFTQEGLTISYMDEAKNIRHMEKYHN